MTFHLAYSYPKKRVWRGGRGGGGKKTDLFHKSTNERSLHVAVHLDCTVLRSTIKASQLPIEYVSFSEYYFALQSHSVLFLRYLPKLAKKSKPVNLDKQSVVTIGLIRFYPAR